MIRYATYILIFSIIIFACNSPNGNAKASEKVPAVNDSKIIKQANPLVLDSLKPYHKELSQNDSTDKRDSDSYLKDISSSVSRIDYNNYLEKEVSIPTEKQENNKETQKRDIKTEIKLPNHDVWNILAKKYVSTKGKVNYKGIKQELSKIESYLSHLQQTYPKSNWNKNESLAYWFNLYNAATVYLIASSYPIKSIRDIHNGKPWDYKFVKSGDKIYSLNQIENTIVRPNFNEPRLHVAFNCAAVSCPKLLNEAFIPSKLNYQLDTLAKSWINDPDKNVVTSSSIKISKIFEWYKGDFKKGIIPFINTYTDVKIKPSATITYLEYNWGLND